jgi:hypothetical protein
MRYPASEKLEIIRTVEGSHLPVKQTLDMLAFRAAHFIDGMIFISMVVWTRWRIIRPVPSLSGTVSQTSGAMI